MTRATRAATRLGALLLLLSVVSVGLAATPASAITMLDAGRLYFIQTASTATGKVEIHTASAQSGYREADLHAATWFSTSERGRGFFQMVGADLWFVKICQTGSGNWELHSATATSGFRSGAHDVIYGSPVASADCAAAMSAVSSISIPKLSENPIRPSLTFALKQANGQVWSYWGLDLPERMSLPYRGGMVTTEGQRPYILRPTAGSTGRVEVTQFDIRGYTPVPDTPRTGVPEWVHTSVFTGGDQASGVLDTRNVIGDAFADVTLVKIRNTGSGRIEVFADDGRANGAALGRLVLASSTWFPLSLAGLGTWQLGSYGTT